MAVRRPTSRLAFASGCFLLGGALLTLLAAWVLPYEGLQDLGRVVMAMLLAAIAAPFFAFTLLAGRGTDMPRWMRATAAIGAVVGLVPLVALAWVRLSA